MSPPRKKPSSAASKRRQARPVLGNDPFTRGAAPRAPAAAPRGPAAEAPRPAGRSPAERLERLEERIEETLGGAEARLEEVLRRSGATSYPAELRELLARLLPALLARLGSLASLVKLLASPGPLDAFGMDERLLDRAAPVLDFFYDSWWRVAVRGIEDVPAGPVVVVANHGGALPWDALVLRLAFRRPPASRELRPLLDPAALSPGLVGKAALRLGAIPATPDGAARLLDGGKAVAVFPEGARVASKPWGERYRLQWFGRGGFAKIAVRAGAPIVPCAVVGSEEAAPPVGRTGWLAEALGLPMLAMAPAIPLGPLGLLPLPSRWSLRFGTPLPTRDLGAAKADDPAAIGDLTERVRADLQRMLDEDVAARRSAYL